MFSETIALLEGECPGLCTCKSITSGLEGVIDCSRPPLHVPAVPFFEAPVFPSSIAAALMDLSVTLGATLDRDDMERMRGALPFTEDGLFHARIREAIIVGDSPVHVSGIAGVHENRDKPTDEDAGELHLAIMARRNFPQRPEEIGDHWLRFVDAVEEAWDPLPVDVASSFYLPAEGLTLPVALPVTLRGAEIPGFSQINGMRLVQVDSENPTEELYSAILQHFGTSVAVQTSNVAEIAIDRHLLARAGEEAFRVARLAVTSLETE